MNLSLVRGCFYIALYISVPSYVDNIDLNPHRHRSTMEEQAADVEVTVKTLDSQSRTYTVAPQVILTNNTITFSVTA